MYSVKQYDVLTCIHVEIIGCSLFQQFLPPDADKQFETDGLVV